MKNLAGIKDCDTYIVDELRLARIDIVQCEKSKGEVPYSITGKLGVYKFWRAWYYWVVDGPVPLNVAEELYSTVVGKRDIRVTGHRGCPPPREWAKPSIEDIFKFGLENKTFKEIAELCECGELNIPRFVDTYHIDSQEGLCIFAGTIKKHGLQE